MSISTQWQKEAAPRVQGSRPLDQAKVQAPGVTRLPSGEFRLFYTAIGPDKPYPACQGYILSAVSDDGLNFTPEPGIRVAPQPDLDHMSLRLLAPTIAACPDGRWRMYFEARGTADRPTVICSAVSDDMLEWEHEEGIRLQNRGNVRAPRYLPLPDGRARLYCCSIDFGPGGPLSAPPVSDGIVSAVTTDGLNFEWESGYRMQPSSEPHESGGFSAAEVIPAATGANQWTMFYSAWQDVPPGTPAPPHPSLNPDAVEDGLSADFAAASIASDIAGFRSRIYTAYSTDGLSWQRGPLAIEGEGYDGQGLDCVHAEDMSLAQLDDGTYRMYYAACDQKGNWLIASARTATS